MPDCGSLAKVIEASTGAVPEFFGKPARHTLDFILEQTGFRPEELAVIGDRLYTDIALAHGTPVTSILVLTGEASRKDAETAPTPPDLIVESLAETAGRASPGKQNRRDGYREKRPFCVSRRAVLFLEVDSSAMIRYNKNRRIREVV